MNIDCEVFMLICDCVCYVCVVVCCIICDCLVGVCCDVVCGLCVDCV